MADSIQGWVETKKVIVTKNVAHYYKPHYSLNKKLVLHSGILVAASSLDYTTYLPLGATEQDHQAKM